MSKFVQTDYLSSKNILKFPEHFIAIAVTVDDTGITVDSDGKKIVPAGTIVGGDVLNTLTNSVQNANTSATADLVSTGDNNDITVTAKVFKALKVALIDPSGNSQSLKVNVVNDTITVSLATSDTGVIISTAAEVIALLNTNPVTSELILAANKDTDTGAGVVTAVAAVALTDGSTYAPEGVLLNDVDVTYGSASGSMVIHGFVDLGKLPETPSANAVKTMDGRVVFMA